MSPRVAKSFFINSFVTRGSFADNAFIYSQSPFFTPLPTTAAPALCPTPPSTSNPGIIDGTASIAALRVAPTLAYSRACSSVISGTDVMMSCRMLPNSILYVSLYIISAVIPRPAHIDAVPVYGAAAHAAMFAITISGKLRAPDVATDIILDHVSDSNGTSRLANLYFKSAISFSISACAP